MKNGCSWCRELKEYFEFKLGSWTHPKNPYLKQIYEVNGIYDDKDIIDLSKVNKLDIILNVRTI